MIYKIIVALLLLALLLVYVRPTQGDDPLVFKTTRKTCDCGYPVVGTGRFASVIIFTRDGFFTAKHFEYR